MKKIAALLLSLVLVFGCGVAAVSADGGTQDYTRKMDAALTEKLSDPNADQIDVVIFLKSCIHSEAEIESIISERYTWTTQQEHLMCWRKVVSEIIGTYVQQFIDDNAGLLDEIMWQGNGVEMIIATVSKENLISLARLDTVSNMYLYVEVIPEPEIEPGITEQEIPGIIAPAVSELYIGWGHTVTAEDIILRDYYVFSGRPEFAVYFYVKGLEYTEQLIEEHIGDWLLVSPNPEPYLFVNNKLYTLKEAYDAGLMTDAMLEELAAADFPYYSRLSILTRYIKGDADGDGECNIVDATVIQRYDVSMIDEYGLYKPLADADGDGEVTVVDATVVQRFEAGMIDSI